MSIITQVHDTQPLLVDARTAAGLLSISERQLWALTKGGQIACVRIGKRGVRYDPVDLREFVEKAKQCA